MKVREKWGEWVVAVGEKAGEPAHLLCERCRSRETLEVPASVDDFLEQLGRFSKAHGQCAEVAA